MRLLSNYFWWTYERGSFHYDVMVTLILAFLFISPHYIDFKDKPAPPVALMPSEVLVKHALGGGNHMTFEVRSADIPAATSDDDRRADIQHVVESIAGPVTITSITPVADTHGKIVAYDATITR